MPAKIKEAYNIYEFMRIGFFTDGFLPQPNGVATSVFESAKELERRGHEVFIIAPKYPGYIDHNLNVIRLTSLQVNREPETRIALHLPDKSLRRVMGMDFDIIHGHSGGTVTLIGWEVARAKKIPFIVTYHTLWNRYTHYILKGKVVSPKMMERATKLIGNRVDCLIAPTKRVEEELRRYGVKKPISVVPSGINVDKFSSAPEGFLRKKIGVSVGPIILFVGRLGREKSVDFLIKAFAEIVKDEPIAHFAIVGEGTDKKRLVALSRRLGVTKNIHFVGEIKSDEMYKTYRDASVFVFSSATETQGLVLPEALSSGVPVVAVDDPAFACIENGKNGFLVPRDVSEFAIKTLSILKNIDLASEMSKNAIASAQLFNVKKTVDSLEGIYYKLLDDNNKESAARIMAENKRSEQFFVYHLIFWATIIVTRLLVFVLYPSGSSYPGIFLGGSFFTLFEVGLFILLVSLALALRKRSAELVPLVFFGVGSGFVVDELVSIIGRHASISDYWSPWNLLPILFFGIAPLLFSRVKIKESPKFFINTRERVHKNPENPKISVVIPAYNEANFIETTLKSLLAQTYKDFELIVVDNNSTDETAEIARKFGARVITEKQKGVAWARQAGFMAARSKIIASTDSDSVVPENWVEKMVEAFEDDPEIVAFGGLGYLYSGPVGARAAGRYLFPAFWKLDRLLSGGWNLSGFNMAVRRDVFLKIGGFRTDMTLGEDIDLARRLREHGKVEVDTKFMAFVSGRRYKDGLLSGVLVYAPSYIMRVLFHKDEFLNFTPVRSERSVVSGLTYLPIAILILFLATLFYASNPQLASVLKLF